MLQRLAFVALAAFLWVVTKSASTGFALHVTQEVDIVDIPGVIPEEATQSVAVELILKGSGLKMLGLRLSGLPTLNLGYHQLNISTWGQEDLLWWVAQNRTLFESELPDGIVLVDVKPDSLFLPITPIASKAIPVLFQGVIPLPEGYQAMDIPRFEPKSVVVYGPQDDLSTLNELALGPADMEAGTAPGLFEAKLEPRGRLTFSHQRILMTVQTEPFTEWHGAIPVVWSGVPRGIQVWSIPDSVQVSIPVPVRLYRRQAHADWVAAVDYAAWKASGSPELIQPMLQLPGGPILLPAIRPIAIVP